MNWQHILKNPSLLNQGVLIDGEWLIDNRETFAINNPATGEIIAQVAKATDEDLNLAVSSAELAMAKWRKLAAKERSRILRKFAALLVENADDLATILTLEQGKPLIEARGEIIYGASYLEWYAEEAKRVYGETIPANNSNQRILVQKEPIGVCAAITPWNFPNAMLSRKIAPALASGCSIIAKPASQTPLSTTALAYLALEAGVPAGVFNVVHGHSGKIGEFFCSHPSIRKLSFTGSTEVGVWLYQNSANTMKKLSLELGGNAPLIVFPDADLDIAIDGIIKSKFRNAGQTCVCSNRIFVHNSIKERLVRELCERVSQLKVGNGLESGIEIGPLIDEKAVIHAQSLISDAIKNNAKIIYGGKIDEHLGGLFFQPTLVECPSTGLRLFKEEIFAPILACYGFDSDEEVVKLANDTPYGLASYFFSRDIGRIYKVAEELQYGIVGVNTGLISAENVPFGGIKMSGLGREGGSLGINEYLTYKYICIDIS